MCSIWDGIVEKVMYFLQMCCLQPFCRKKLCPNRLKLIAQLKPRLFADNLHLRANQTLEMQYLGIKCYFTSSDIIQLREFHVSLNEDKFSVSLGNDSPLCIHLGCGVKNLFLRIWLLSNYLLTRMIQNHANALLLSHECCSHCMRYWRHSYSTHSLTHSIPVNPFINLTSI